MQGPYRLGRFFYTNYLQGLLKIAFFTPKKPFLFKNMLIIRYEMTFFLFAADYLNVFTSYGGVILSTTSRLSLFRLSDMFNIFHKDLEQKSKVNPNVKVCPPR